MVTAHGKRASTTKRRKQRELAKKVSRALVVVFCVGGFIYQTIAFLLLYWTYPTVVDIQQSSPSYLEVPSFSICNPIGYNYTAMCVEFGVSACLNSKLIRYAQGYLCLQHPNSCIDNKLPKDYTAITFNKFLNDMANFTYEMHNLLRTELESYMECTIEYAGTTKPCNMENVMGSFFTKDELPQYCYSIYSLWGQPEKKREKIPKGTTMKFHFFLNATHRASMNKELEEWIPKHNTPTTPSVQIAVHSPYFLPSPYVTGSMYQGGKNYELRITMEETHLLTSPYQTNCTDYMEDWKKNGGRGPVNQMGVVQLCRVKLYVDRWGCVPVKVDYPHTENICGLKVDENNDTVDPEVCTLLADHYNQPCDSINYEVHKEEVEITEVRGVSSRFLPGVEEYRMKFQGYDCSERKVWNPECSTIDIFVIFDRFEITNLTYNPKFESLEMFSVIGGYMGMWLGISLVTVYDFIGSVLGVVRAWTVKKRRKRVQPRKKQSSLYGAALPYKKNWQAQYLHNRAYDWQA